MSNRFATEAMNVVICAKKNSAAVQNGILSPTDPNDDGAVAIHMGWVNATRATDRRRKLTRIRAAENGVLPGQFYCGKCAGGFNLCRKLMDDSSNMFPREKNNAAAAFQTEILLSRCVIFSCLHSLHFASFCFECRRLP